MSSKGVPDAWDDDWVEDQFKDSHQQDSGDRPKKLSKAERRRQQLEFNKKIWEEAETTGLPYLVQKSNDVPLQSGYTPNVKVLSRNAETLGNARQITASHSNDFVDGEDGNDDDEQAKSGQMTPEERAEKLLKEREEKQKKYDEAREKIFGTSVSKESVNVSGFTGARRNLGAIGSSSTERPRFRGRASAGGRGSPSRQLYDPNAIRSDRASGSGRSTQVEGIPFRNPKGPDGSGYGGRGFTSRGGGHRA